jgi:hypothetical protein
VQVRSTLPAQFKGLDQPVMLYDISGISGSYHLSLPEKPPATLKSLSPPLPLVIFPIDGKIVSQTAIPGCLTGLAGATAEGSLVGQVAAYSNIKIELHPLDTPRLSDVYAKVLAVSPTEAGTSHVRLELTSLPEGAKAFLAAIEQSAPLPS